MVSSPSRCARRFALLCAVAVALLASAAAAGSAPRFVLIHVDAVAAADLDRLLAEGRLPNVARAFEGGIALDAVTAFVPATPVIYSRMHGVEDDFPLRAIGFGGVDRDTGRVVTRPEVVLQLFSSFPRRARAAPLHGATDLDAFAGLGMLNLPQLLERYGTVEVFWFSTDVAGHLFGREGSERSLERFDRHLGRALERLDLSTVNLVLYTDHGMTFSTETFDVDAVIAERLGDAVLYFHYPHLYLHDTATAAELARRVTEDDGLDFAFYRQGANVVGYLDGHELRFETAGDTIRYLAEHDPLGYGPFGYDGEWLTRDEWVALTIDAHYPATPVVIVDAVQERHAGDLVVGINPPRNPHHNPYVRFSTGSHWGLIHTDLVVKVLASGPDVEPLREQGLGRLEDLYVRLPDLTFGRRPTREPHSFTLTWHLDDGVPEARARYSLAYRTRLGLDVSLDAGAAWAEYDVFSSYLTRWWLGAGAALDEAGWQPLARLELEVEVAEARLHVEAHVRPSGWQVGLGASYRVAPGWWLTWDAPAGVGASYEW